MQWLNKAIITLSDWLGWVALFFMAFLMLGTTVDVITRSVTGRSISGVFELAELSMVLVVFLGLGWTKLDDAHIRVTMLTKRMSPMAARVSGTISWGSAALLLLLLAIPASQDAAQSFAIREFRWGYVEFPIWWAKIVLAIGLWFAFAQLVFETLKIALFGAPAEPQEIEAAVAHAVHEDI